MNTLLKSKLYMSLLKREYLDPKEFEGVSGAEVYSAILELDDVLSWLKEAVEQLSVQPTSQPSNNQFDPRWARDFPAMGLTTYERVWEHCRNMQQGWPPEEVEKLVQNINHSWYPPGPGSDFEQ